jgi:hypothetical protein
MYAGAQLLGDRSLLDVERDFLESCRDKAQESFEQLRSCLANASPEYTAQVLNFATELNEACRAKQEPAAEQKPAVEIAKQLSPTFTARETSPILLKVIAIRLFLIQHDTDELDRKAA